jgi:hypothetical protein
MKHRKLRIAWSVAWGIACVLLIVLWVRSYWWVDIVYYRPASKTLFLMRSDQGAVSCGDWSDRVGTMGDPPSLGWTRRRWPFREGTEVANCPLFKRVFRWFDATSLFGYQLPVWFPTIFFATFAVAPWIVRDSHWRFSLRTLLIATTLVAVLLGLIVWLRQG